MTNNNSNADFQDRMYLASEAVYERIVTGQCSDAAAELFQAQVTESTRGEEPKK